MKNKCPKCGFEYNEFDVFCARCGMKLSDNEFTEAKADRNTSFLKSKVDDIKVSHKDVKNRLSFAGKNVAFFPVANSVFVFTSATTTAIFFISVIQDINTFVNEVRQDITQTRAAAGGELDIMHNRGVCRVDLKSIIFGFTSGRGKP